MKKKGGHDTTNLQLGLCLSLLEDGLHLCSLHDVSTDLELATHEQPLSIGLAGNEIGEIFIGEDEGDISLSTRSLRDLPLLLEVQVPGLCLAFGVAELEGVNGTTLLDGILALGVARGEDLVHDIESRGGGERSILDRHV